jgi:hypothetical protein
LVFAFVVISYLNYVKKLPSLSLSLPLSLFSSLSILSLTPFSPSLLFLSHVFFSLLLSPLIFSLL